MSGIIARRGFSYQDSYLLLSVLEALGEEYSAVWNNARDAYKPPRFGIEASTKTDAVWRPDGQLLDWDMLVRRDQGTELTEVKSGAVVKADRKHLWLRLRRELSLATRNEVRPRLVVDPDRLSGGEIWREFARNVWAFTDPIPANAPERVTTSRQLVEEALWFLCSADSANELPQCALDVALASLSTFQLLEHRREDLDKKLSAYVRTLFADGETETVRRQMMAWISERAQDAIPERHLFTPDELVREVKILEHSVSADAGAIKRWRHVWDSLPALVASRSSTRIGNTGASLSKEDSQPTAVARLNVFEGSNIVIRAPAGIGKSAFLAQLVAERPRTNGITLWCGATDAAVALGAREFSESVRFQADLATLRNPEEKCTLYVDGLDEVDGATRDKLAAELQMLSATSNIRIVVSIRDSVWQDGAVQHHLSDLSDLVLEHWSEEIVSRLFNGTAVAQEIRGNLLTLLRTPILLDLFWRTFLEGEASADRPEVTKIQTRHGILAAFWSVRLLNSTRVDRVSASACIASLAAISESCANQVGPFETPQIVDAAALKFLISESVLVEEGHLQRRLRFRHPLFRDFALAQWCLAAGDEARMAERWRSIQGPIQRVGCLRSIIEAFDDPSAATELPGLRLQQFLIHVASAGEDSGRSIARCLGALSANEELDPSAWHLDLQAVLPTYFGADIILSAQNGANPSWGVVVGHWADDVSWCGPEFPERLLYYGEVMHKLASSGGRSSKFGSSAAAVAKKVRHLSECPQFATTFCANDSWLKAKAIRFVATVEPSLDTVAWLEREIPNCSWRTQDATLEILRVVAPIDPYRIGVIYRQILRLHRSNGTAVVDADRFEHSNHFALELSLTGNDSFSLLTSYPHVFVEIAVDLAEALWTVDQDEQRASREAIERLLAQIPTEADVDEPPSSSKSGIGDLIDDSPNLTYWKNSFRLTRPKEKIPDALARCLESCYQEKSDRGLSHIILLFRASRLASIHSLVFDCCLKHSCDQAMLSALEGEVCDRRLYEVLDLWYWIERAIELLWPCTSKEVREAVVSNINATSYGDDSRAQLLCRIPERDLIETDLNLVADYRQRGYGGPLLHPEVEAIRFKEMEAKWTAVDPESDWERWMGKWPESVDADELKTFHRSTEDLQRDDLDDDDDAAKLLPNAIACGEIMLQELLSDATLITAPRHQWVLARLDAIVNRTALLDSRREQSTNTLSEAFVRGCAAVAWVGLHGDTNELKMEPAIGDSISKPGHLWDTSLSLLESAMVQPPLRNDSTEQRRFETWLAETMRSGSYILQQIIAIEVRPWHWFRTPERRALFEELLWVETKHAAPIKWSLQLLRLYSFQDQERILRLLLNRHDIEEAKALAESLGEKIGMWSLSLVNERRLPVAALGREAVQQPSDFALLKEGPVRMEFLRSFMFGLKEAAKSFSIHTELVPDYAAWSISIWRHLRQPESTDTTCSFILFVLHWLGPDKERALSDIPTLRRWGSGLSHLLQEIVETGSPGDVSALFQLFSDGRYANVFEVEELIGLISRFYDRFLTQITQADAFIGKWSEAADYAAESVEAVRRKGLLTGITQRNQAYDLLTKLANMPVTSSKAASFLVRLQAGDE